MNAADQFEVFKDLQEIVGVSDADLALLLAHGCAPAPLINYEDGISELLVRWLRHMSGVPWVRAFQHGARPSEDETGVEDGQYGTIQLMRFEPKTFIRYEEPRLKPDDTPYADFCEELSFYGWYTFQLDVFRDSGVNDRGQTGDTIQRPIGSAFDVLLRVSMRMYHWRWRQALKQYCVQYPDRALNPIHNLPQEKVKSTFESRATAQLRLFVSPSSTMRQPGIPNEDFVPFEWVCPDPQPEPSPVEC